MSTTSLFRKWRSQTFEDLVGQKAVVRTLRNALQSGSPARAYLFCGPRGTGKTSTARIFAKALNCQEGPTADPCGRCGPCRRIAEGSCMDVLEIDAASHTQVEKVREFIVDKVHFAPAEVRFKVYIIDEVHKLSTSSFNALLKTLEEPPPHVVFILATTHPQDLLPTILSRCQRHDFQRLSQGEIREQLLRVAGAEAIELEAGAGEILARSAEGSLRDALVQLEQVATFGGNRVTEEDVRTLLGLAGAGAMRGLVGCLRDQDAPGALRLLHDLVQGGRDLGRLASELVDHLRRLLLVAVRGADAEMLGASADEWEDLQAQAAGLSPARLMAWLKAAMEMQGEARDPARGRLLWEMTLIRLTVPQAGTDLEALVRRVEQLEKALQSGPGRVATEAKAGARQEPRPAEPPEADPRPVARPSVGTPPDAGPAKGAAPPGSTSAEAEKRVLEPSPASLEEAPARVASPPANLGWDSLRSPAPSRPPSAPRPAAEAREERPAVPPDAPASTEPVVEEASATADPARAGSSLAGEGAPRAVAPEPPSAVTPEAAHPDSDSADGGSPVVSPGEFWRSFMAAVKEQDRPLEAMLKEARLVEAGAGVLRLSFPGGYTWHCEKVQGRRALLEKCAGDLLGGAVTLHCAVDGGIAPPSEKEEHETLVRRASHLFSGRVVEGPQGP